MKRLVWTDTHTRTHLGRKRQDLPYTTVMHFAPYARVSFRAGTTGTECMNPIVHSMPL
jgi:hypothetical protein